MLRIKKVKRPNRYQDELKRKIAQEYLSGRFSYAIAAEEYGLTDKSVVREFVRWFRRNNELSALHGVHPPSIIFKFKRLSSRRARVFPTFGTGQVVNRCRYVGQP